MGQGKGHGGARSGSAADRRSTRRQRITAATGAREPLVKLNAPADGKESFELQLFEKRFAAE
jgi:hypothetical protein